MRNSVMVGALIAIVATVGTARADDGYYLDEALGAGGYRGELAGFDAGAPRFHLGFAARRGDHAVELFGAFEVPDLFYIDCYGEECAQADRPHAGLGAVGLDLRKRWRLLSLRRWNKPGVYERPGVFVALHGGARWVVGTDAIDGYRGPGLGGGATLEGDLWVLGYYVDVGLDVFRLEGPGGEILHGSTPYLMFGGKLGWL